MALKNQLTDAIGVDRNMVPLAQSNSPQTRCILTIDTAEIPLKSYTEDDSEPATKKPKLDHAKPKKPRLSKIHKCIQTHNFATKVQLICPSEIYSKTNEIWKTVNNDLIMYYKAKCALKHFFKGPFQTNSEKMRNKLSLVSLTKLDCENSFALVDNSLYVSLNPETYRRAGLTGKFDRPKKSSHGADKYFKQYDLYELHKGDGKRLLWALENTLTDVIEFGFAFQDLDKSLLSEIEDYFKLEAIDLEKSIINKNIQIYDNISTTIPEFVRPSLSTKFLNDDEKKNYDQEVLQEWAVQLNEWTQLVSLNSYCLQDDHIVDNYICSYSPQYSRRQPKVSGEKTSITVLTWSGGLIPRKYIVDLFNSMCSVKNSWATLSVHGYQDTPVSWGSRKHTCLTGGDNSYTIIKLEDSKNDALLLEFIDGGSS